MARRGNGIARSVVPWVLLAFVTAACTAGPAGTTPTPAPVAELECEAEGYPCSIADVPLEILERSDDLANEVRTMFEQGSSTDDVRAFLDGQDGMAEVDADESGVRFRLDGGRAFWILRETAVARGGLSARTRGAPVGGSGGLPRTASLAGEGAGPPPRPAHVAGGDLEARKALVLSPMRWDFGDTDDGEAVAAILSQTRGYENGVTFLANDALNSATVGVDSFKGWGAFQLIHVVTHGTRICKAGSIAPCRAAIAAGTVEGELQATDPGLKVYTMDLITKRFKERALTIDLGKVVGLSVDIIFLTADFFRAEYPGGLSDTVMFFNACKTLGSAATDLADAVGGSTSVVLGWDQNVISDDALATGVALYTTLSEGGYQVEVAHEKLGDLRTDRTGAQLMVRTRSAGGDLRIRDVVTLRHPLGGATLAAGDEVFIIGTPGDGEPDAAPYLVQVDGIPAADAPSALLHVSVDGIEAEPRPVAAGLKNEQDSWELGGAVDLKRDLGEETPTTVRAWVELPSGGQSDHEVPVRLVGERQLVQWRFEGRHEWSDSLRNYTGTATAEIIFGAVEDPTLPKGQRRFEVTGGTWTWGPDVSLGPGAENCMHSSTAVSVDLSVDQSSAEGSYLIVDTTTDPMTAWGIVTTIGPDATRIVSGCYPNDFYNGAYQVHTRVTWMAFSFAMPQPVTDGPDGPVISGSRSQGTIQTGATWSWTITPIE